MPVVPLPIGRYILLKLINALSYIIAGIALFWIKEKLMEDKKYGKRTK